MACGHIVHVVGFAARRLPSVKHRSIPGRDATKNLAVLPGSWLHCCARHRRRSRDHRRSCCYWPLQPSIRLHCPGGNRSQYPGHCQAGNPHKQPEWQGLLGVHVGCFWSNKHPLILPAREPITSNKIFEMQATNTAKSTHLMVRTVSRLISAVRDSNFPGARSSFLPVSDHSIADVSRARTTSGNARKSPRLQRLSRQTRDGKVTFDLQKPSFPMSGLERWESR